MERKSIMFVISKLNYGGAGKMLTFLSNNLSRLGHKVTVYTYASNENHYPLDQRVKYIYEKKVKQGYISKRVYPIISTRKIIMQNNPDIIISFLTNSNFISIIASINKNVPVIICERSDPYNEKSLSLNIMRFFYRFANGFVFQTKGAKNYYNKKIQKKSKIIPNPVPLKKIKKIPYWKRKKEIAFVARFDIKQKRQDLMIKAFKKVLETHEDIKLVFYGDGPDLKKIKKMAEDYKIINNIVFAGRVDNIIEKIQKSYMFVLTSDYEGIPNSLLEAMSIGLPVVSTDCSPGGARLLIKNNNNGLLVPKGDVDAIADSIIYLIDNPEVADKLGKEAQNIIELYSPNKIIKEWIDYINKVAS